MGLLAILIGGPNNAFAWGSYGVLALVILPLLFWSHWPRPQLKKDQDGWKLQRGKSAARPARNASQGGLFSRLLIAVAVLAAMWLLVRSH